MTSQEKETLVEVCPVVTISKQKMIDSFKSENVKWEKEEIYPFSKYAMENYPDICIGNCEECKNWKTITEKELWMKDNDTVLNHVKYRLRMFVGEYVFSLPIMFIASPIIFGNFRTAFFMSFATAMFFEFLHEVVGFGATSFEEWLENKWETQQTNNFN